jgi:hypothetical protein
MAVNGKNKGSTFERKIANLLSERFEVVTGIKQGFRRNPDSGSFFGGSNKRRTETHDLDSANFGDLICPKSFKYSVECKHYKTAPSFAAIVKGKVAQWDGWISQAAQDAAGSSKEMLLIVKYNGVDEVAFLATPMLDLQLVMPYKQVFGYRLEDLLKLNNNIFFDTSIMVNANDQQMPAALG